MVIPSCPWVVGRPWTSHLGLAFVTLHSSHLVIFILVKPEKKKTEKMKKRLSSSNLWLKYVFPVLFLSYIHNATFTDLLTYCTIPTYYTLCLSSITAKFVLFQDQHKMHYIFFLQNFTSRCYNILLLANATGAQGDVVEKTACIGSNARRGICRT